MHVTLSVQLVFSLDVLIQIIISCSPSWIIPPSMYIITSHQENANTLLKYEMHY